MRVPSDFIDLSGHRSEFDLDSVYEVVRGYSKARVPWTSIVVYESILKKFIEICSSPQDVRGDSADEAEEVTVEYVANAYGLSALDLERVAREPRKWKLVDRR